MNIDEMIEKANAVVALLKQDFRQVYTKEEWSSTNGEFDKSESLDYVDVDCDVFSFEDFKNFSIDSKFELVIDDESIAIHADAHGMSVSASKIIKCYK